MRVVKFLFLIGSIVLLGLGLYQWLWVNLIDYAALYMALAAIGYGVYLHITKSDRK